MCSDIVSALDDNYPALLRLIVDYPPIVYVKGDIGNLNQVACAVVGTRQASHLGTSWAKQIAATLTEHGLAIVSGLALGIDTAAHEGTLRASGKTIAILAHGLDRVTPSSNAQLAARILGSGGSLLSEHPPGVPPRRAEYVRRNRLQSGMSVCSIVVESAREGGAIHQARFTKEQGRDLFTVIPGPETPGHQEFNRDGAQYLIGELGARVIGSKGDLLDLLGSSFFKEKRSQLLENLSIERRLF